MIRYTGRRVHQYFPTGCRFAGKTISVSFTWSRQPRLPPRMEVSVSHTYTIEKLYHFQCESCHQWWTIGDWDMSPGCKGEMYCPTCGAVARCEEKRAQPQGA